MGLNQLTNMYIKDKASYRNVPICQETFFVFIESSLFAICEFDQPSLQYLSE